MSVDVGGLGSSAARGAAKTMLGQLSRLAIQLAGIFVLARLLNPEDYGLLAMVVAIIGVGEIFRDFGLSSAAIQSKTLTAKERDNLFWLNTGIGFLLMLGVIALSFVIPVLYGQSELQAITAALSLTFLANGISTQQRADLSRTLQFGRLAVIEVVAPLIALIVAVSFAISGAGYWSLVAQQLTLAFVSMAMLFIATKWIPGPPHRGTSVRRFVGFGINLLGVQLLTYASRNIDSVMIGTRFGPTQLGFYDRAFQLLVLPLNQINAPATRVALPVLSRLQDDAARFGEYVVRGQTILVHILVATFAFAIGFAPALIPLVLGDQWQATIPLFQVLAIGGIAQALSYATYWVFLASGRVDSNLRFSLLTRPILIGGIIVASFWSPLAVALVYSVLLMIFWPFGLWWISRITGAPAMRMFLTGARALLAYSVAAGTAWAVASVALSLAPLPQVAVGLLVFCAVVGTAYVAWPAFRRDVKSLLAVRRLLRNRGR